LTNKKVQIFAWLVLAILSLGNGVMNLTLYNQMTWSILASSMQILGGIILFIVIYSFQKERRENPYD